MEYDYHKAYKELNEMFFESFINGEDWSVQDLIIYYEWMRS